MSKTISLVSSSSSTSLVLLVSTVSILRNASSTISLVIYSEIMSECTVATNYRGISSPILPS